MGTGNRSHGLTRPAGLAAGICGRCLRATLLAAACAWLAVAGDAPAANLSTTFMVSVEVVGGCSLAAQPARVEGKAPAISCARGTAYQLLIDGRPATAGVTRGATEVLLHPVNLAPVGGAPAGLHWLTILY